MNYRYTYWHPSSKKIRSVTQVTQISFFLIQYRSYRTHYLYVEFHIVMGLLRFIRFISHCYGPTTWYTVTCITRSQRLVMKPSFILSIIVTSALIDALTFMILFFKYPKSDCIFSYYITSDSSSTSFINVLYFKNQ